MLSAATHLDRLFVPDPHQSPLQNSDTPMKKFMYLHYGFEKPSPEIMAAWRAWFESVDARMVDKAHFPGGREITKDGVKELPFGRESITGFCILRAEDLDEAEQIAQDNPFIAGIRVYEMMG